MNVSISGNAAALMQLDDRTVYPSVSRTVVRSGRGLSYLLAGDAGELENLANEFAVRGIGGDEGFDYAAQERRACRVAAKRIRLALGVQSA